MSRSSCTAPEGSSRAITAVIANASPAAVVHAARARSRATDPSRTVPTDRGGISLSATRAAGGLGGGGARIGGAWDSPPFASLIRIVCAAVEEPAAADIAAELRDRIDPPDADILGPAPLFTLRG